MGWTRSQEAAMTIPGKTLLVSAAAGSGKTSVLTERIIRSLTDPDHPADLSRILVVTFTRAAAAELKGRIATALSNALAEHPENKYLSRQLFYLGSAQISTIDSFFQKIVRANFEKSGLPPSFRLADENETEALALEILEGLIEEFYHTYTTDDGDATLFGKLQNNRFAIAIDHLISDRSDGKLNSLLLDFVKAYAADPEGVEILKKSADALRRDATRDYLETSYGRAVKRYLEKLFAAHISFLEEVISHLEVTPDMKQAYFGVVDGDLGFCRAMAEALQNDGYERVREVAQSFVKGNLPTGVKNKDKTAAILTYQAWRTRFYETIAKKVTPLLCASAERLQLEMQATADLVEMLYYFYTEYEARLMAEKKTRGILEYNDVRAMLCRLLSDTEFADALAAQYDAVYIDEYQDVDFLQDRIFAAIGRDHRFMVGDIKQSIYGFRGSEPSIFAGYRRQMPLYTEPGAADAPQNCVFMSENFRCDRPVIRFANRICSFLFSACEESIGYRPQDDLVCSKKDPDVPLPGHPVPVKVAIFDAAPRQSSTDDEDDEDDIREEAVYVAGEISRLLRKEHLDNGAPITPSDIAILVRNHSHGKTYTAELQKLNIPVASAAASNLMQDAHLFDILNLLRAVDNPYRDLPLSEFLLSPIGGFSLEELCSIRDAADENAALYDALSLRAEAQDALGERCAACMADLAKWRKNATVQPADRFLRLLYLEDALRPYADHPAALLLYEEARVYQRSSFCGLYGFLDHFSKKLEAQKLSADGFCKAESAVTIMTVHHSKGLEFPVVFLSSTGSQFNKDSIKKSLQYHRHVGCGAKLYNRETGMMEDTALRSAVKLCIGEDETEESIRTLYVALTRARERLYVTGTLRGKWDTTLQKAMLIRRGDRAAILSASSNLYWILAALYEHGDPASSDWGIVHHPFGTVLPGEVWEAETVTQQAHKLLSPTTERYADLLRRRASFAYPNAHLHGLPAKLAASKLRSDLLDTLMSSEDEDLALDTQLALLEASTPTFDAFIAEERRPSAAAIGTATHAFLQFCDLNALSERTIQEERERLVDAGYLDRESADIIRLDQLERFCRSDLYQMLKTAKSIRREQTFGLFLPAIRLTKQESLARALSHEKIFVQGSIDLLLETEDGRIILIDYKTDHIPSSIAEEPQAIYQKLYDAHGDQLAAYACAVKELFGAYPDEIRIYSIPLGRTVLFPLSEILQKM